MQIRIWALPFTLLLSLVMPTVGMADGGDGSEKQHRVKANLVETLRASFIGYRHSAPDGYIPDPYCASGENGGAVGIHFVKGSLVNTVLEADQPEVLYYEPLPGGRIRLAGAEYVYLTDFVGTPPVTPQHLEGHLLNYMGSPNRFGIPGDWLRLNVWAWKRNPNGTFAGDNPRISCDAYDPNLHPQPPQLP